MMRKVQCAVLWLGATLLVACGSPPASGPSASESATETVRPSGPTARLSQLDGRPLYNLEAVAGASNPLTLASVRVAADEPLTVTGWAVDPQSKTAAGGVDVAIDGAPYPAQYGLGRKDVADRFQLPAYTNSGFALSIPAAAVGKGKHRLAVRVISSDKAGYREGRSLVIDVQ